MTIKRTFTAFFVAALLLFLPLTTAWAATGSGEAAGKGSTGSVSVTMKDTDGKTVSGGSLAVYKVAAVDNGRYVYMSEFSKAGVNINDQNTISEAATAKALAGMVTKETAAVRSVTLGSDGAATVGDLSNGLYLFIQNKAAKGYSKISPFLVSVIGGAQVDATPKVERVSPADTPEPNPEPTPTPGKTPGRQSVVRKNSVLPQTGQLWWPVWVMTAAGGVLIIIGEAWKRTVTIHGITIKRKSYN